MIIGENTGFDYELKNVNTLEELKNHYTENERELEKRRAQRRERFFESLAYAIEHSEENFGHFTNLWD